MKTPVEIEAEIVEQSQPDGHPLQVKISNAMMVADIYGAIDGAHHKAWVLDQVIRALTGCKFEIVNGRALDIKEVDHDNPSEEYKAWIAARCEGGDYEWDEGIAP